MTYRILNTLGELYTKEARPTLEALGEVQYKTLTQEELTQIIREYDIAIIGLGLVFDRALLEKASKLKVIATATTGLNHIDLDAAKEKGVEVLSLRGENNFLDTITSTAELAMGLMIDLLRFNPWAFESVKKGKWERERFRGWSLYGKTIGVVGMGRLGKIVARAAHGFRMRVIFCDPHVSGEEFPDYKKVSFDELLSASDIISIHVHLAPETEKLFDAAALSKMKPTAFLINTSRGEIVDEDALLLALTEGTIAGYGADVLAGELSFGKTFSSHSLVEYAKSHRNCIILPHTGGMTHDSRAATDIFIAEKLKRSLEAK